jgi:alpha-D-ribose 1-methylphosphonate 5-triphosphate synthase subunit PhnH
MHQALEGGFADAPIQSARAFRRIMRAMARPGDIQEIGGANPPAPLSPAAGALILTLCDTDTPLYLAGSCDTEEIRQWIAFHTGAPLAGPQRAAFALGYWQDLPLSEFPIGTAEYPDRAATVIVEMDTLHDTGATLTGPGIRTTRNLSLPETEAFRRNAGCFPLGLDFFFTCGDQLAGLPRSTRID